jgi:hypothetical protein
MHLLPAWDGQLNPVNHMVSENDFSTNLVS